MYDRRLRGVRLRPGIERRRGQRRRWPRTEVSVPVLCSVGSISGSHRALNLSAGGSFLRSHWLHPVGSRAILNFRLDGYGEVQVEGEVRALQRGKLAGMHVEFLDLTPLQQRAIEFYCEDVDPLDTLELEAV